MKKYPFLLGLSLLLSGCSLLDKAQTGIETYQDTKALLGNKSDHHTVIVAGYGAHVKGNKTYEEYVKSVAVYVSNVDNGVDSVIFSGGYTNEPDKSEAEAMNSYFNGQVDLTALQQRGVRVYKEECSIVSWQNISYSQEILAKDKITPSQVTLFGDADRQDKLTTFAVYKFNLSEGVPSDVKELVNRSLNAASVDFQGFDFGDSVDSEDERQAKFAAEILGAYDAKVGNELLAKRLTEWSDKYGFDVAQNLVEHGCTEYKGF